MKNQSVAKTVTRRVTIILIVAFAILLVGSFCIVRNVVFSRTKSAARQAVSIYSDLVLYTIQDNDILDECRTNESISRFAGYLCQWCGVDYVYMYIPDVEKGTIKYIVAAVNQTLDATKEDFRLFDELKYELTDTELSVWDGEDQFQSMVVRNDYGKELSTFFAITDAHDNRVIVGIDKPLSEIYYNVFMYFAVLALIITAVVIAVNLSLRRIIRKQVSEPSKTISSHMSEYILDGRKSEKALVVEGGEEYRMIASSFNKMTADIDAYVENINNLTREKERQKTELEIAEGIQKGFLQDEYFASSSYGISAMMNAAKNVGGDLYDYLSLDDGKVLIVIADVSGKGVAAAMFMAVTLTLIRQYAKMGLSPDEILRRTNSTLTEKNQAMLFVTAIVAIYDPATHTLEYSNAGHNFPYLLRDKLTVLDEGTGTLLGLFAGEEYNLAKTTLKAGDVVYMYTDGVNETTDSDSNFFGMNRLEDALAEYTEKREGDVVDKVYSSIKAFSGNSEQHDDITMLSFCVKESTELLLDYDVHEMPKIKETIMAMPIAYQNKLDICLASEEIFVNICSYAFKEKAPEGEKIKVTFERTNTLTVTFEDGGKPYNPIETTVPIEDYDIDTQDGGLGRYMAFSSVDHVEYQYLDGKNIMKLQKKVEEE